MDKGMESSLVKLADSSSLSGSIAGLVFSTVAKK